VHFYGSLLPVLLQEPAVTGEYPISPDSLGCINCREMRLIYVQYNGEFGTVEFVLR
jgi:hypothetical protein